MLPNAFTLIECLIVILLASILLFCAIPSFEHLLERYQLSAYVNRVISSIQFARLSAMSRQMKTQYCGSNDLKKCTGSWTQGQLIESNHYILRSYPAWKKGYELVWKGSFGRNDALTFEPNGFTNGQQGSFYFYHHQLCLKKIIVSLTGRIRIENCRGLR